MWPIWGRQDPGGPHIRPMNFAIWDVFGNSENMQINILQTIDVTGGIKLGQEYTWVIIWMLNSATHWVLEQNSTLLIENVLLMCIFWSKP